MYIIGIDVAIRRTGVAALNTETKKISNYKYVHYIRYKFDDTYESSIRYYDFISLELKKFMSEIPSSKVAFVVESLPAGGHYATTIKISNAKINWYHAIKNWIESNTDYTLVTILSPIVNTWKKKVLGRHNTPKQDTEYVMRKLYTDKYYIPDVVYNDVDMIDAAALAIYGDLVIQCQHGN